MPSALATAMPCVACVTREAVRAWPLASVSFASTVIVATLSSKTLTASSAATGATFTTPPVTVMVTVAVVDCSAPSVTRYVKVSVPV